MKVYILIHDKNKTYFAQNQAFFDAKLIGIFETKKQAKATRKNFRKLNGFKKYKKGFKIIKMQLDKAHFNKGF